MGGISLLPEDIVGGGGAVLLLVKGGVAVGCCVYIGK